MMFDKVVNLVSMSRSDLFTVARRTDVSITRDRYVVERLHTITKIKWR